MNAVSLDPQPAATTARSGGARAPEAASFRDALDGEIQSNASGANDDAAALDARAQEAPEAPDAPVSAEGPVSDDALASENAELAAELGLEGATHGPAQPAAATAAPAAPEAIASAIRAQRAATTHTAAAVSQPSGGDETAAAAEKSDSGGGERFTRDSAPASDPNRLAALRPPADPEPQPGSTAPALPDRPEVAVPHRDDSAGSLAPAPASAVDTPVSTAAPVAGGAPVSDAGAAERMYAGSATLAVRDRIEWLATRGGGRARLELSPPELGRVDLVVRVRGETVDVRIVAHEAATANLLQGSRAQLGGALENHDLHMARFEVGGDASGGASEHDRGEGPHDAAPGRDGEAGPRTTAPQDDSGGDPAADLRDAAPGRLNLRV